MTKTDNQKTIKKAEGRGADLSTGAGLGDVPRLGAHKENTMGTIKVTDLTGESKRWLVTRDGKEIGVIYYQPFRNNYSAEPDGPSSLMCFKELQGAIDYISKYGKETQ